MYIISAIPLVSIPRPNDQVFSYFCGKALPTGAVVEVPVGKRSVPAIVIESKELIEKKAVLRKAKFELKPVKKVVRLEPIFSKSEVDFIFWVSEYYFAPLGLVAKMFVPEYLLKRPNTDWAATTLKLGTEYSPKSYWGPKRFEEYKKAAEKTLKNGRQALVLFPETGAAEDFLNSLPYSLRKAALLWNAKQSAKQDYEVRKKIINGEYKIIAGTRSTITVHLPGLGLVVVDDEASHGHKSWDMRPHYDARTLAAELARRFGATHIIGGLVPSVRAFQEFRIQNPEFRIKGSATEIVDMRQELRDGNLSVLSRPVQKELSGLRKSEQAILFIDRLGEHTVVLCRDCGHVLRCPKCSAALVTLSTKDRALDLFCRFCRTHHKGSSLCPECRSHYFRSLGAGTERVEKEVKKLFPALKTARLDSFSAKTKSQQDSIVSSFLNKDINVLVGTHSALQTKLLEKIKFCAIVSLETTLFVPEYSGEERALQLALKIKNQSKNFLWQTYNPDHRVVTAVKTGDVLGFLKKENELRKEFNWPPFAQLVKLALDKRPGKSTEQEALALADRLGRVGIKVDILGPVVSKSLWIIILSFAPKTETSERSKILSHVPPYWRVDVDPVDTLS